MAETDLVLIIRVVFNDWNILFQCASRPSGKTSNEKFATANSFHSCMVQISFLHQPSFQPFIRFIY